MDVVLESLEVFVCWRAFSEAGLVTSSKRPFLRYICDVPECNHRIHTYPDELHQGLKNEIQRDINKLNEAGVISPRVNIE